MINQVFSIRDTKANAYLTPFFMVNEAMAIRAITDLVNDPDHSFCKHSEDYALYSLGVYDDATGKLEVLDAPLHVVNAVELKSEE